MNTPPDKKPMTAKEELTQIRHIDQEITFMLEQLEELETSLTRISPVLSDMPTCHDNNRDKIADGIVRIVELKITINKRIDYLYDYKRKMTEIINKIENPVFRRILATRYFKEEHNSFEEIATAIGYSYYPTIHMHGVALQEFTKIQANVKSEQDLATY